MKKIKSRIIAAIAFAVALSFAPVAAPAADVDAPAPAVAETIPAITETTASATAWYFNGELWTSVLAVIGGLAAIWRNSAASRAEKINDTLILAVEEASKNPAVAKGEAKLKAVIQEKAQKAGVEPALNRLVKLLTP